MKYSLRRCTLVYNKQDLNMGFKVNIEIDEEFMHYKIAPVTLQNLIENAIKHNIIDIASPLIIDIYIEHDYIVVKNNIRKNVVETSNKKRSYPIYHFV